MPEETNSQENQNQSPVASFGLFLWDLVKIFLLAMVIILPVRTFLAEPFMVSGSSMIPNFHDKDYLIVDRLSYRMHNPQRGDVIVLKFPKDTTQYFIKRIIGLPGETVICEQGRVAVEASAEAAPQILAETYLPSTALTQNCKPKQVLGSDEYFVLGDNRMASSDSRVWGILPKDDIVGRVWLRIFPFHDFGFMATPSYAQ
ncbi:MAG: signal peptidase I [Patescibacteria group bacterium]|nr:signal peptidase I [Patescibacteria group bacterium]